MFFEFFAFSAVMNLHEPHLPSPVLGVFEKNPGRGLPPAVQACPVVHLLTIDEPSPTD